MVKIKNKFTRKALAFASAFLILCSVFILPCLAQAPDFDIDYSTDVGRMFAIVYEEQSNDIVMLIYTNTHFPTLYTDVSIVLTEYYYNEYYAYDVPISNVVSSRFSIIICSHIAPNGGGTSRSYVDNIFGALNTFYSAYIDSNPFPVLETEFSTLIGAAQANQFIYWENRIQDESDVAFDNGFAEGQQVGLQTGYNNGYNDGFDGGLLSGYDQGYEIGLDSGKSIGYTNGYTQAVKDMDAFERGLYDIFNAPFVFVKNISTFEIFGVNLLWILSGILLICLGFILIKFIRGALPL